MVCAPPGKMEFPGSTMFDSGAKKPHTGQPTMLVNFMYTPAYVNYMMSNYERSRRAMTNYSVMTWPKLYIAHTQRFIFHDRNHRRNVRHGPYKLPTTII